MSFPQRVHSIQYNQYYGCELSKRLDIFSNFIVVEIFCCYLFWFRFGGFVLLGFCLLVLVVGLVGCFVLFFLQKLLAGHMWITLPISLELEFCKVPGFLVLPNALYS